MIIKTFADKSTTIISESNNNFGSNPILSLFFGAGGFSRILINFNLNYIRRFVQDKTFPDLCRLKHTMKLWNCGNLDFRSFNSPCPTIDLQTAQRAQSFELIMFKIPQFWDNGRGYDADNVNYASSTLCGTNLFGNNASCEGVTWHQSRSHHQWGEGILGNYSHLLYKPEREYFTTDKDFNPVTDNVKEHLERLNHIYDKYGNMLYPVNEAFPFEGVTKGIYTEKFIEEQYRRFNNRQSSIILRAKHFEYGNENMTWDVSDIINDWLLRDNEYNRINHGFAICFSPEYNRIMCDIPQCINFFGHNCSNFFEPYIETSYEDVIKDDRENFYMDMPRRLYFYFNHGYGKPTNLAWKKNDKPICTITGTLEDGSEYTETPEVIQATKGVYYVETELSSNDTTENRMFYDIWSNLSFYDCDKDKIIKVKDKTLEFTTKDTDDLYSFGDGDFMPKQYSVSCSGIKYGEKVRRDDGIRRLMFEFNIPFTYSQSALIDDSKCMLFIKDGYNKIIDVWHEWQPIHKTFNANFIYFDCQSYLPNKYYLDVMTTSNGTVKRHVEVLNFEIVSNETNGHYV
jgi:hypothetical protein